MFFYWSWLTQVLSHMHSSAQIIAQEIIFYLSNMNMAWCMNEAEYGHCATVITEQWTVSLLLMCNFIANNQQKVFLKMTVFMFIVTVRLLNNNLI